MTAPTPIQPKDPLVGQSIDGRYLVRGVLGRGGMGVVYDGVHEQLGRAVAIKVLGPGIAGDAVAVERFLREARTASGLTHGNIVDVSDLGQLPDGRPYLVMAKMAGEDLCSLLFRTGPQTPQRTVELLRGVAAGLDLVHAKGFVHRDIKLENLMHVVREDGSESVMVLDFGIVGLVATNAKRLTSEGSVFGTPAYLPPEVIEGETMDRRGDIYALATCAFELMTGFIPFDAENPVRILPMKMMQDAPSMTTVSERIFPQAVEAVIARNLARKPSARHPSAGAFIAALDEAVRASADFFRDEAFGEIIPKRDSMRAALRKRLPSTSQLDLPSNEYDLMEPELDDSGFDRSSMPTQANEAQQRSTGTTKRATHSGVVAEERQVSTELPRTPRRPMLAVVAGAALGLGLVAWAFSGAGPAPAAPVTSSLPPSAAPTPSASAVPAPAAMPEPMQAPVPTRPMEPAVEAPSEPRPTAAVPIEPAAQPRPSGKRAGASKPAATPAVAQPSATPAASPVPAQSAAELNQAAMQAFMQGHTVQARELYTLATRRDPLSATAFRGVGLTQQQLGRKDEAIKAFKRALELAPDGREADSIRTRLQKLGADL